VLDSVLGCAASCDNVCSSIAPRKAVEGAPHKSKIDEDARNLDGACIKQVMQLPQRDSTRHEVGSAHWMTCSAHEASKLRAPSAPEAPQQISCTQCKRLQALAQARRAARGAAQKDHEGARRQR
jgi:hypothetical protein